MGRMMENNIVIYQTKDGQTDIDVRLENETVWLSQKQMAELFDKDVRTINEHITNVYTEGELEKVSTIRKFRIVQTEGKRQVERNIDCYNLDVIISVGYRVKSVRGTQFRIWATQKLKDYLVKGFAVNEKRLREKTEQIKQLQHSVDLLNRCVETQAHNLDEAQQLTKLMSDFVLNAGRDVGKSCPLKRYVNLIFCYVFYPSQKRRKVFLPAFEVRKAVCCL